MPTEAKSRILLEHIWVVLQKQRKYSHCFIFKAEGTQVLRAMTRIFPADSGLFISPP
jgi:hypothetical protein